MVGGAGWGAGVVVGGDGKVRVEMGVDQLSVGGELGGDDDMVEDLGIAVFDVGPALAGWSERARSVRGGVTSPLTPG